MQNTQKSLSISKSTSIESSRSFGILKLPLESTPTMIINIIRTSTNSNKKQVYFNFRVNYANKPCITLVDISSFQENYGPRILSTCKTMLYFKYLHPFIFRHDVAQDSMVRLRSRSQRHHLQPLLGLFWRTPACWLDPDPPPRSTLVLL